MDVSRALALAEEAGFSHAGGLNPAALQFRTEVRDMCRTGRCGSYGKNWTCPPHCGTLDELESRARRYTAGILVQSTGQMEDDFDVECMMDTEQLHKQRFARLASEIRKEVPDCLPMGCGACQLCPVCGCPDEPCRHPDLAIPSMEACGLVVSDVCAGSDLPYYYGPQTITYTSCVLLP